MIRMSLLAATVWYAFDQLTKWWILETVKPSQIIEVASFFNVMLGWNTGVSFGLLQSFALPSWALALFAIGVSVMLLVWFGRATSKLRILALGLIVGGALGNATDRLRHGAVVDFLDFYLGGWHWPAFNMADIGIVCGTAMLCLDAFVIHDGPKSERS